MSQMLLMLPVAGWKLSDIFINGPVVILTEAMKKNCIKCCTPQSLNYLVVFLKKKLHGRKGLLGKRRVPWRNIFRHFSCLKKWQAQPICTDEQRWYNCPWYQQDVFLLYCLLQEGRGSHALLICLENIKIKSGLIGQLKCPKTVCLIDILLLWG